MMRATMRTLEEDRKRRRGVRALAEILEPRHLLAGPDAPSLSLQTVTPTSITFSYSSDGISSLALEELGPGDQNLHTVGAAWNQTAQTVTVSAQPNTHYTFRLAAELDCLKAYASASADTPEITTGDQSLPAPVLGPAQGGNPDTRVGVHFPALVAPATGLYWQQRWDDRPASLGGPTWGTLITSSANGYSSGDQDFWFGDHPGFHYSIRAYVGYTVALPGGGYALKTSPWSEPFSGTVGGAATAAPTLTATRVGPSAVDLSWSGPADYYTVLGGNGGGATMQMSVIGQNLLHAANLAAGTWQFVVFTHTSAISNTASASVGLPVASGLRTCVDYDSSSASVNLAWDNASSIETGYEVQRSADGGMTFTTIGSTGPDVTTYKDDGAGPDATYTYRFIALADAGTATSDTATAKVERIGFFDDGNKGDKPIFWADNSIIGSDNGGHGNQGLGAIDLNAAPVIDSGVANGVAWARVRAGTGLVRVVRSYNGVIGGDQGANHPQRIYISPLLASQLNDHEQGHIHASQIIYEHTLKQAADGASQYRKERLTGNAGETAGEVKARLESLIGWGAQVTAFAARDTEVNRGRNGTSDGAFHTWETNQGGGPNHDLGARTVDGIAYVDYCVSRTEQGINADDTHYTQPNYLLYDPYAAP